MQSSAVCTSEQTQEWEGTVVDREERRWREVDKPMFSSDWRREDELYFFFAFCFFFSYEGGASRAHIVGPVIGPSFSSSFSGGL